MKIQFASSNISLTTFRHILSDFKILVILNTKNTENKKI